MRSLRSSELDSTAWMLAGETAASADVVLCHWHVHGSRRALRHGEHTHHTPRLGALGADSE